MAGNYQKHRVLEHEGPFSEEGDDFQRARKRRGREANALEGVGRERGMSGAPPSQTIPADHKQTAPDHESV